MKSIMPTLPVLAFAGILALPSLAQNSPPPVQPAPVQPGAPGQFIPPMPAPPGPRVRPILPARNEAEPPAILKTNYQVRLVLTQGEKTTEFTLLTAAPSLSFSGTGAGNPPVVVSLNGTLTETGEGKLVMNYILSGRIPAATGEGNRISIQYQDESSSGAIHVTPGKPHTLIKSGDRTYSVTISPDEEAGK